MEARANAQLEEICRNIKATTDITIYTVTFHVDDADTRGRMRTCAAEPSSPYYSHAEGNNDIGTVFDEIAESLITLRISR